MTAGSPPAAGPCPFASSRTSTFNSCLNMEVSMDTWERTCRSDSTPRSNASLPASVSETTCTLRSSELRRRVMWLWASSLLRVWPMVWACTRTICASAVWVMGPVAERTSKAMTPAWVRPIDLRFSSQACSTNRAAVESKRPVGQRSMSGIFPIVVGWGFCMGGVAVGFPMAVPRRGRGGSRRTANGFEWDDAGTTWQSPTAQQSGTRQRQSPATIQRVAKARISAPKQGELHSRPVVGLGSSWRLSFFHR
jgi:hypothetical protein